jgi:uncharacterized protein (TIGR03792 family)
MFLWIKRVVIEWLRFQVEPEQREAFVQKDAEVWTAYLKTRPGFLKKSVWLSSAKLDEVVLVILWTSQEQWDAIPKAELDATERRFAKAFPSRYKLVESQSYQIRKTSYPEG